jgi:hypothetical protein
MKNLRHGRVVGILFLGAIMASMIVPAAEAGNRSERSRSDWRSAGRDHGRAWSDHPAHRWFDSREYCGGKDARGHWLTGARCEDRYGRKWVDNADWVARHQWGSRDGWRRDEWRADDRRGNDRGRRDDRYAYRNR